MKKKIAITARQEQIAQDAPQNVITISLDEQQNIKKNAYLFNNEALEEEDEHKYAFGIFNHSARAVSNYPQSVQFLKKK